MSTGQGGHWLNEHWDKRYGVVPPLTSVSLWALQPLPGPLQGHSALPRYYPGSPPPSPEASLQRSPWVASSLLLALASIFLGVLTRSLALGSPLPCQGGWAGWLLTSFSPLSLLSDSGLLSHGQLTASPNSPAACSALSLA